MRSISRILLASCLVLAAACRGGGDDDGDDGDDGPDGSNPNDVTIYDIQNPDMRIAEGIDVTVRGVVVTAIDEYAERADGTRVGTIWIQEPAGGEYSGVLVFGAPLSDVANLNVGDVIDITGVSKTEFVLRDGGGMPIDTSGRTTTELEPGSAGAITITVVTPGGTAPTPQLVDAVAIDALDQAGKDAEWEKWEGVLIRVENVSQVDNISAISGEANFLRFKVTGNLEVDTSLSAFPPGLMLGSCIASITGIGDYFFNHKILPRETAELVDGGSNCPPVQVTTATVTEIQTGTATGLVQLNDVVVTGVTFNRSNLFVADALQAAPNNGVFVFRGGASVPDLPAEIVIGATVDISGEVVEFMGVTEITNPTVTFVAAPAGVPTPVATTIADLNNATTGEPFEGVLVQLSNVRVDAYDMAAQKITLSQGTDTILTDDDIYRHMPVVDDCYASVTGIFHWNNFDLHLNLLPTLATDIVPGGTCP